MPTNRRCLESVCTGIGLLLVVTACCAPPSDPAEESLRDQLLVFRTVLAQFQGDQGRYPKSLGELVETGYLKTIPFDPVTRRNDTWIVVPAGRENPSEGIKDVRSGAPGLARDGTPYSSW